MTGLKEEQYRSWVEVDLDSFTGNLQEVRRLVGPGVKILQVVKADAYGHGAMEIAQVALKNGASYLGVANADEGVQLRVGGITAPIVILSPSTVSEISDIIKYTLTPSVSDLAFAGELQKRCQQAGVTACVHVEVDTGMGRGGAVQQETINMIEQMRTFSHIELEGIFTHLSQSETPAHYNSEQWLLFQALLEELEKKEIVIPLRHMANSGAILNFPLYHLDMVRPGLMTFGIYPSEETHAQARLAPVMSFKTRVVLLKDFPAGASIGYGRSFITTKPTRIATIPVGYGDGYGFILSNQGEALIRGKRVPVVGRISMDMCTLDVSAIPTCQVDDEVVLMGSQGQEVISADEIAAKLNTISYEILCTLGKRAPRLFLQNGRQDSIEPRLRRIFLPDEEKSLARIDNVIRRCLHTRANNVEYGDAIYYTMFETLFGKADRQLELRSNFKYTIRLEEFMGDEREQIPEAEEFYKVTTSVEYVKTLKYDTFMIGCAENSEQLAALFADKQCEYRWLLNKDDNLLAARDFLIRSVRLDDEPIPPLRMEVTERGGEAWYGGAYLADKLNRQTKVAIEVVTKRARKSRDLSVYLIYPVRGLDITFQYRGTSLKNVRELAFFAGRNPYPAVRRQPGMIEMSSGDDAWVFPNSGVTFIWDYEQGKA